MLTVEQDSVDMAAWHDLLVRFDDASFYQTWAYGQARWPRGQLRRLIVKSHGEVLSLAQVRVVALPLLRTGIGYVAWGPSWRRTGCEPDPLILRCSLLALRETFCDKRGLALRLTPNLYGDEKHPLKSVFLDAGFAHKPRSERTIVLDLSPPLEELRGGFRRRWRQTLAQAEKKPVDIVEGSCDAYLNEALEVYYEMQARKKFAEFVDMKAFIRAQADLPKQCQLRVVLVRSNAVTLAALVWSAIGCVGLPLLAATSNHSMGSDASYLTWWHMITWLKERGYQCCDLGGVNPQRNPGGYTFKTGIGKTHGREVSHIGEFTAYGSAASRVALGMVDWMRERRRQIRIAKERSRALARSKASVQPDKAETTDGQEPKESTQG